MSDTVSGTRRLRFDELDPELADTLRPRYERLGYLGGFFAHMGHQPAALAAFERFTLACRQALPVGLAEVVALTAATRLANDYERHQHERLAVRSGCTLEWVAEVERLDPDGTRLLDPLEQACQRYVLATIDRLGRPAPDTCGPLTAIRQASDDATASAVALLTARYIGHATVVAACELAPPVPSIFDDAPPTEGSPPDD